MVKPAVVCLLIIPNTEMQHVTQLFFSLQKRLVSHKVSNVKAFMNSELDESLLMVAVSSTHVKNWHLYTVYRKIGSHYCDISHLLLMLSLQTHSLWVTHRKLQICASQSLKLSFPVKKKVTCLRGDLTFILLLCLQAWHPAESPSECSSSPAAPSTSPWAGRASRAGGRDPGLWRWGAGGPRRLLQRSAPHTHTLKPVCPSPLLPLSTSAIRGSTMAALSHTVSSVCLCLRCLLVLPPSWQDLQQRRFSHQCETLSSCDTSISRLFGCCQRGAAD